MRLCVFDNHSVILTNGTKHSDTGSDCFVGVQKQAAFHQYASVLPTDNIHDGFAIKLHSFPIKCHSFIIELHSFPIKWHSFIIKLHSFPIKLWHSFASKQCFADELNST